MFANVLVANRGEIAVRVLRGLRDLGIASVAVYSEADRRALHVRRADEAVCIGPAPSAESYLNQERILGAARQTGAEAIHPGYGFLSENAEFAAACEAAGFVFIGPGAAAIRAMGLKTEARLVAQRAGTPTVPGTESPLADEAEALSVAASIGYPVMLKAAAGGGGKGMRRVASPEELGAAFREASSEAERSFKNGAVYLEKLVERPRHIEIQILGDRHGHMIYLGERECSVQRRHQKVIEECPSPFVAARPELRRAMGEAAVRAARAAGYVNAGTVEFLVDPSGAFYFLEMNTRLQVEHPVTELVTGLDLVEWQLRIAADERLTVRQEDVAWRGWAMECRVCAEDPAMNFLPSPGRIERAAEPSGPGIRVDSGIYSGWTVPMEYDSLLAKLIAVGESREQAMRRLRRALGEYAVTGIETNLAFLDGILADPEFARGELHTGFIEEYLRRRPAPVAPGEGARLAAALAVLEQQPAAAPTPPAPSNHGWLREGRERLLR
ncbi:MAG: acetyl-CoA carboxylase biotin carboxylase subunit [Bryobacterales bacterium]|nr:acetyl-CoA carboxylase biotin carboxylase subunit [Bryobacterales bacterium]